MEECSAVHARDNSNGESASSLEAIRLGFARLEHGLLNDIAICIVVAWILAVVAQWFRQPLILSYLVAGFAVGPLGFRLVSDQASIQTISELGLILLLFMIGLEIDLKKMLGAGKVITWTGLVQIVGGCLLGVVGFAWAGFPLRAGSLDALYLAVASALSSTVIVVKILYEKRELDTLPGRLTLGVLVLQDLFAILFLAVQPNLKDPSVGLVMLSLLKVLAVVVVAFAASRYALPPLFRSVARLPELVLVGALAWCFLVAGFAGVMGLSREMGALIAGVAISTFPYTLDVSAKVTTLRDFFVTLFFVALGTKVPSPTWHDLGWAAVLGLFLVVSRFLTVFPVLSFLRMGHRASLLPAINLAQLSELSLVILALGEKEGHIQGTTVGVAAYAFITLAVGSTYAMNQSGTLLRWMIPALEKMGFKDLDKSAPAGGDDAHSSRIFFLGFSWTASSLLEEIRRHRPEIEREVCVIDFNPHVHEELRRRGIRVIYGDITQRDTLLHAGLASAEVILCTLPNTVLKGATNLKLLQQIRDLNPEARVIMHAELFQDVPKLYAAGANFVSVPRLTEASELLEVIDAARNRLLEERKSAQEIELQDRREVIP